MKRIVLIMMMLLPLLVLAQSKQSDEYYNKGVELYNNGKFQKAIPYFEKSNELDQNELEEGNDRRYYSIHWLANCYYKLGDVDKAQELLPDVYYMQPVDRNLTIESDNYIQQSYSYAASGDYGMALSYTEFCADKEKKELGENHWYYANSLLSCAQLSPDLQYCRTCANKAFEIFKKNNFILGMANALMKLADVAENNEQMNYYYKQAVKMYVKTSDKIQHSVALISEIHTSSLSVGIDNADSIINVLQPSIDILKNTDEHYWAFVIARGLYNEAMCSMAKNEMQTTFEYASDAKKYFEMVETIDSTVYEYMDNCAMMAIAATLINNPNKLDYLKYVVNSANAYSYTQSYNYAVVLSYYSGHNDTLDPSTKILYFNMSNDILSNYGGWQNPAYISNLVALSYLEKDTYKREGIVSAVNEIKYKLDVHNNVTAYLGIALVMSNINGKGALPIVKDAIEAVEQTNQFQYPYWWYTTLLQWLNQNDDALTYQDKMHNYNTVKTLTAKWCGINSKEYAQCLLSICESVDKKEKKQILRELEQCYDVNGDSDILMDYIFQKTLIGDTKNMSNLIPKLQRIKDEMEKENRIDAQYFSVLTFLGQLYQYSSYDISNAIEILKYAKILCEEINYTDNPVYKQILSNLIQCYEQTNNVTEINNIRRILRDNDAFTDFMQTVRYVQNIQGVQKAIEMVENSAYYKNPNLLDFSQECTLYGYLIWNYVYVNDTLKVRETANKIVSLFQNNASFQSLPQNINTFVTNDIPHLINAVIAYSMKNDYNEAIAQLKSIADLDPISNYMGIDAKLLNCVLYDSYLHTNDFVHAKQEYSRLSDYYENKINDLLLMPSSDRGNYFSKFQNWCEISNLIGLEYIENDPEMNSKIYDNILLYKGLLLNTEIVLKKLFSNAVNNTQTEYLKYERMKSSLDSLKNKYKIDELKNDIDAWNRIVIEDKRYVAEGDEHITELMLQNHMAELQGMQDKFDYLSDSLNLPVLEKELLEVEKNLVSKVSKKLKKEINISWQDVRQKLSPTDIAIEFVKIPLDESIVYGALLVKQGYEHPRYVRLCREDQISSLAPAEMYNSSKLFDLVWKPLEDYLNDVENVYFSPTGSFCVIGLEYLPDEKGTIFARKFNSFRLTSTRELVTAKEQNPSKKAVIYGGIKYSFGQGDWEKQKNTNIKAGHVFRDFPLVSSSSDKLRGGVQPLLGTKIEAKTIANTLRSADYLVSEMTGALATEESFKKLSGSGIKILHIGTHGFYQREANIASLFEGIFQSDSKSNEDMSLSQNGLLLAGANSALAPEKRKQIPEGVEDGILTAKEISRLDFKGLDLVVLSACETGLGEITGDGVFGLQRGFKKAGAQTIVMSLWKVADDATQLLMTEFFKNLTSGMSKRESFIAAQNTVKEKYPDPMYWAAFIMVDGIN